MRFQVGFLLLLLGTFALGAEPTKSCGSPEHRQFDFWVGSWTVQSPDGKPAGRSRITSDHHGCAILERWDGTKGLTGSSLNIFDPSTKQWHQTWVDSSGTLLQLDGTFRNGSMQLSGTQRDAKGAAVHNRITWSAIENGRVKQLWEQSNDGKEWKTVFVGIYIRE